MDGNNSGKEASTGCARNEFGGGGGGNNGYSDGKGVGGWDELKWWKQKGEGIHWFSNRVLNTRMEGCEYSWIYFMIFVQKKVNYELLIFWGRGVQVFNCWYSGNITVLLFEVLIVT